MADSVLDTEIARLLGFEGEYPSPYSAVLEYSLILLWQQAKQRGCEFGLRITADGIYLENNQIVFWQGQIDQLPQLSEEIARQWLTEEKLKAEKPPSGT